MAERLVGLSKKRSYEKGKRMNESLTERSERLSKKRKSQVSGQPLTASQVRNLDNRTM